MKIMKNSTVLFLVLYLLFALGALFEYGVIPTQIDDNARFLAYIIIFASALITKTIEED